MSFGFIGVHRRSSAAIFLLLAMSAKAQDRWTRLATTHFEMYTSADESKSRDVILHLERVREFFMQASPVRPPGEFPVRIVVFKDPDEMHIHAPNRNVAAFFAPGPLRDSIVMANPGPDTDPIAIHEYVHLVIRHSGLKIPLWLNEGWAEVFSTLKPVRGGVAVGDLIQHYLDTLSHGNWFTLKQLETIDRHSPDYSETSRANTFYAESWALTHMLYLAPDYKDNFGKFVNTLNKGQTLTQALQIGFNKTPDQVLEDLKLYFERKSLYGTVFLTPFEKTGEKPEVSPIAPYDRNIMFADIDSSVHHFPSASRMYQDLQAEEPKRPDAFGGAGYLAILQNDKETARTEFHKAFDLGTTDPQLCMQLAELDREAKQPESLVRSELEQAVKLRPDFSEAIFQLALMKVNARDFDSAFDLLGRVGIIGEDRMYVYRSAFGYVNLEKGNIDAAREDAGAARRAARTKAEADAADRFIALVEARASGPAAVKPGEQIVRKEGTAIGLRCAAKDSKETSKMGIMIDGKQMLFDMPDPAAVEVTKQPGTKVELKCGALPPFHLFVEYAPSSPINRQTAGIIRRIEY
jgi:tetratricopeptide (TPR) repeat protein